MNETCDICGGVLVMVRGRYLRDDKRQVCPTCMREKLDIIKEVADDDYRRAYADGKRTV